MLSGGTQRHALPRHQSEEMKIYMYINFSFPRVGIKPVDFSHFVPLRHDWPLEFLHFNILQIDVDEIYEKTMDKQKLGIYRLLTLLYLTYNYLIHIHCVTTLQYNIVVSLFFIHVFYIKKNINKKILYFS